MYKHLIFTILFMLLLPTSLIAAIATSDDWDTSLLFPYIYGWRQNTASTIVRGWPHGGNPEGYLRSFSDPENRNPIPVIGAANEDSRYTGDYQVPNITQVDVDLNLIAGSITHIYLRFRYLDSSHNGWMYEITNSLTVGVWTSFQIPFDPNWSDVDAIAAGWIQEPTSASFSETMQQVYTVEIRVLSNDITNTQIGIDNFTTISGNPAYIPGPYNYYLPYFYSGDGTWTGLGLANLNQKDSSQLQVGVFDSIGDLQATENKTIAAYGQDAFPVATQLNSSGWMRVNSFQPLSGLAFLGSGVTPSLMADIPFISELSSCLVIPHIAQDDTWDTTILICNPNNETVSVALKYIDKAGVEQGAQNYSIPAHGSGEYLLSTVFSDKLPLAGRVEINSSNGIAAFALYSDQKSGGSYYAGINAESCE